MLRNPDLLDDLQAHMHHIAGVIGERPPASAAEEQAFTYIRQTLHTLGIDNLRTLRYTVPHSEMPYVALPAWVAAITSFAPFVRGTGWQQRISRVLGVGIALSAARYVWQVMREERPRLPLIPTHNTTTQIARIAPTGDIRHQLVLLAHVDSPQVSSLPLPLLQAGGTLALGLPLINALGQVVGAVGGNPRGRWLRRLSAVGMALVGAFATREVLRPRTQGANANASGVAALLTLAQRWQARPLAHTEVWLVFTGGETTGGSGTHALLDSFGRQLTNARFVNVEAVGVGRLATISRRTGLTVLTGSAPDPYTVALMEAVKAAHPVLGIEDYAMPATDAVQVLRQRGYNGITLTGFDPRTYAPAYWRSPDDTLDTLDATVTERVVLFIEAFGNLLDSKQGSVRHHDSN